MEYPVIIVPLSEEDGGGFLGYAPDLVGCMSDGDTPEEAILNTQDAISEWIDAAKQRGLEIPEPHSAAWRERAEKERLVQSLKEVMTDVDHIEHRLRAVEEAVREIEEKIDSADAWSRFASLTGMPGVAPEASRKLLPC